MVRIRNKTTGKIIDISEDQLSNYGITLPTKQSQNISPQVQQPIQEPKSLGGFISNVGRDAGENIQGISQLPGFLMSLLSGQLNVGDTAGNVVKGVVNDYKDLVTNPIETGYNKPLTTLLNVLPFFGPAKSLLTKAGVLSKGAKAADILSDTAKLSKLGKGAKVSEIIGKLPDEVIAAMDEAQGIVRPKGFGESMNAMGKSLKTSSAGLTARQGAKWASTIEDKLNLENMRKYVGAPEQKLYQVGADINAIDDVITSQLKAVKKIPPVTTALNNFRDYLKDTSLTLKSKSTQKTIAEIEGQIKNVWKNAKGGEDIGKFKSATRDLVTKALNKGAVTEKDMVREAFFYSLKDTIEKMVPGVRNQNTLQYKMYDIADDYMRTLKGNSAMRYAGGTLSGALPPSLIASGEDKLGRLLQKVGQNKPLDTGMNTLSKILGTPNKKSILPMVGRNLIDRTPIDNTESNVGTETSGVLGPNDIKNNISPKNEQMITKEMAMMAQVMLPPKEASKIMNMYTLQEKADSNTPKRLSSVAAKDLSRNKTALKDYIAMEKILFGDKDKGTKGDLGKIISGSIPGSFGARTYRALWGSLVDALGTNRTGAAYTKEQRKDYAYLLPAPGDSPKEIREKMDRVRDELSEYVGNISNSSSSTDINDLLNQALGQ